MDKTERQIYIPANRNAEFDSAWAMLSLLNENPNAGKAKLSFGQQIKRQVNSLWFRLHGVIIYESDVGNMGDGVG